MKFPTESGGEPDFSYRHSFQTGRNSISLQLIRFGKFGNIVVTTNIESHAFNYNNEAILDFTGIEDYNVVEPLYSEFVTKYSGGTTNL